MTDGDLADLFNHGTKVIKMLIAESLRLRAENERLRDAAENVVIAYGMGWDMDGVVDALKSALEQQP